MAKAQRYKAKKLKTNNYRLTTGAILFLLCGTFTSAAEKLTYIDLINQLSDLEQLAVLPPAGQKCVQWSSYDRGSKYDSNTDSYIDWAANADGSGIIRSEDGKLVLAEMEGPAVIWRIWSATAGKGHVKIYLDDNNTLSVDLPFTGYFNCENEPFTRPALVHTTARGLNCYVPIPFQKSCKIIADKKWGKYYHFTYTTYPKGTILPTFKRSLSIDESTALDKANQILNNCGSDPAGKRSDEVTEQKTVVLPPAKTVTLAQLSGQRAITALKVRIETPDPNNLNMLRELALRICWDSESQPSVWSPLGDFFGTAPGINKYKSLPMGMTEDGFYSYWYMPFEKSALVELTNDGSREYTVTFTITHSPLSRPVEKLGRFHAKWHRDSFLPENPQRKEIDWTMLKTQGRGRYCGVMLHIWNRKGGWWGEGDEKFFVDGEKFPSTFGTGSEDYFGYAWCDATLFSNCYHNQTINTGNRGHISVNRWHIGDNVPFQKSFEAAIEKYFPNTNPTLYACVAYWYLAAGDTDPYQPVPLEQRIGYWTPLFDPNVKDALEGEKLKVLAKTKGEVKAQSLGRFGFGFSGKAHLWWTGAEISDKLDLAVPVEKSGRYKLTMQLAESINHGIVQLYLDGNKLGNAIDLYSICVLPTSILDMGIHQLKEGEHKLTVEITGANPKAEKPYAFGLDYIKLELIK